MLSPCRVVFDWVQEMFAVLLAVCAMEEAGLEEYADAERKALTDDASGLNVQTMVKMEVGLPISPALYGRAFLVGTQLNQAIGWKRLKLLGTEIDPDTGKHDLRAWLADLESGDRRAAERVLEGDG